MKKFLLFLCAFFIVSLSAVASLAAPPEDFTPASNEVPDILPLDNFDLPSDVSYKYSLDIVVSGERTGKSKADLVFILDTTGSMWGYIRRVKNNIINFSKALADSDIDARFAVIEYRDIYEDGLDSTQVKEFTNASGDKSIWTSDAVAFEAMVDSLSAGGGGDGPETPTDAMQKFYEMAVTGDKAENLFRSGAVRFALILTDADAKNMSTGWDAYPSYPPIPSVEDMTTLYRKDSIYTTIVSEPYYDREDGYYYQENYHNLYTQTGGKYIDINDSDYSVIFDIIVERLSEDKDTDGDGLLDRWEESGLDSDGDGTVDVDLPGMGANPASPDMFIYYDWMEKPLSDNYAFKIPFRSSISLKPSAEALELVRKQFLAHGINVHFIEGKALPYEGVFDLGEGLSNWNKLITDNFPIRYRNIARYCVFVDTYKHGDILRSTGVAENYGQFFIIAQGLLSGSTVETASVFMHKLGHTLGLRDGGSDRDSFKPNYLSVMNWLYMTSGLVASSDLARVNYSEYVLPSMDVKAVIESSGIDPASATLSPDFGLGAKWLISGTATSSHQTPSAVAGAGIDFNADGTIDTEASFVNFYIVRSSSSDIIAPSINDWANISIKAGRIGGIAAVSGDDGILLPPAVEPYLAEDITIDELEELDIRGNSGDCTIKSVNPTVIFAGAGSQNVTVTVRNLFSAVAAAEVSMSLGGETYSKDYVVPASGTASADFAVSSSLTVGIYPASISLVCANGRTESKTVYITVTSADPVVLIEGQSMDLEGDAFTAYSAKVEDESIAAIYGGTIFGLKAGDSFIDFCEAGGRIVAAIPVKVTEKAAPVVAPTIMTASIPPAKEGESYDVSFAAMGTEPITWTISPSLTSYGLRFNASGDLSGTLTKSGIIAFTVTATNTAGSDSATFSLDVSAKPVPPVITTAALSEATEGESYDVQLTATGTESIDWSWSGATPKGLTLSREGRITGIPTLANDYTFTVTARNVAGVAIKDFTLTVKGSGGKGEPPSIVTESLHNVKAKDPYSFQMEATGTGPLSWSAAFPAAIKGELSISEKGLITGSPQKAGSYRIVITVKNSAGTETKPFTLTVYSETIKAPTITTKKLPDAFTGHNYSYQLEATEGLPEVWRITKTKGELPDSLELDEATGEISGYVEAGFVGKITLWVVASNDAGASKEQKLTLSVKDGRNIGFKTDKTLKAATFGKSYSMTFKLNSFKATTWELNGDLPEGITFDTVKGKLSGKPTEVDEFEFTVTASNGAVSITDDFELTVKGILPKLKKSFTTGYEGSEYNCVLQATGTTPITWEFSELPEGLDYTPDATGENCTVSGIPTKAFKDNIEITITNVAGEVSLKKKLTIKAVKPTFDKNAKPGDGFVGEDYYFEFSLKKSPVEVEWEHLKGSLPNGLYFEDGVIEGEPTKSGTFNFTILVRNANKQNDKATWNLSIHILPSRSELPDSKGDTPEPEPVPDIESEPEFVNGIAYYERGELSAEILARAANADEIIVAVLPKIEVEEANTYDFTVELDESAPEGATLVWHSYPDGEDDPDDESKAFFLDGDDLTEIVPASRTVTVSAWLEPGIIYEPVIAVKLSD